ncbi:uncharacterized protein [Oscarella lobularis]|uniref:uncharacterized protein n=1 Tax=Oscarella lobularis TaxID=121494 RepID=UPI0033130DE3
MNDLIEIAEKQVIGESKEKTGVLLLLLKSLEFDANNLESEAFIEATVGGHFLSRCPTNSLPCAKHALLTVDPDARSSDFVRLGLTKLSEFGNDFENLAKGDVECNFAETSELQRNVELRNSSNEVVATVDLFVKFFDGSFGYSHKPTFRSTDEVRYCLFPRIISTDPRLDHNGRVLSELEVSTSFLAVHVD